MYRGRARRAARRALGRAGCGSRPPVSGLARLSRAKGVATGSECCSPHSAGRPDRLRDVADMAKPVRISSPSALAASALAPVAAWRSVRPGSRLAPSCSRRCSSGTKRTSRVSPGIEPRIGSKMLRLMKLRSGASRSEAPPRHDRPRRAATAPRPPPSTRCRSRARGGPAAAPTAVPRHRDSGRWSGSRSSARTCCFSTTAYPPLAPSTTRRRSSPCLASRRSRPNAASRWLELSIGQWPAHGREPAASLAGPVVVDRVGAGCRWRGARGALRTAPPLPPSRAVSTAPSAGAHRFAAAEYPAAIAEALLGTAPPCFPAETASSPVSRSVWWSSRPPAPESSSRLPGQAAFAMPGSSLDATVQSTRSARGAPTESVADLLKTCRITRCGRGFLAIPPATGDPAGFRYVRDRLGQVRALADQVVGPVATGVEWRARHREQLPARLLGQAGSDEAARARGGLDDHHTEREPGDDAVPARESGGPAGPCRAGPRRSPPRTSAIRRCKSVCSGG